MAGGAVEGLTNLGVRPPPSAFSKGRKTGESLARGVGLRLRPLGGECRVIRLAVHHASVPPAIDRFARPTGATSLNPGPATILILEEVSVVHVAAESNVDRLNHCPRTLSSGSTYSRGLWSHVREQALSRVKQDCGPVRFKETQRTIITQPSALSNANGTAGTRTSAQG